MTVHVTPEAIKAHVDARLAALAQPKPTYCHTRKRGTK
jgi:hypothetical protein